MSILKPSSVYYYKSSYSDHLNNRVGTTKILHQIDYVTFNNFNRKKVIDEQFIMSWGFANI